MSFTRFPNLIETIAREQTDSEDGRYVSWDLLSSTSHSFIRVDYNDDI
jgi:hypothetical protein